MIKLIIGNEGTGKTKRLLDAANNAVADAKGHIVYLDKSGRHMFEINNKVRLIDVSEFGFHTSDEFFGFVNGIISQDRDIEQFYFDSFKKLANIEVSDLDVILKKFDAEEKDIPDCYKDQIIR